jgi:uncharacterized protein
VEVRQTHISIVAIAPPNVYKIKKPLDLGFLDFSTLEKRRHFCLEEVRLNRRLTQDVYLDVVPIARRGSCLHFGPEGEIVEYAVKMRELARPGFLHERLARGVVTADDLERVAARLAAFYQGQQSSQTIADWGRVEKVRLSTDENFAQTERFADDLLSRPAFAAIRFFTDRFYERHADLFERRRKDGRILDGHGDLRCEHVHFADEEINIFDCIEFNERLRFIDVANDAAFLAMDLDVLGRPDLGAAFLRRIAGLLDDPELLSLTNFYKCYRAYVRGKVAAIKSVEPEVPVADRVRSRERATQLFQRALDYAVAGSEPLVLTVMGRIASGKSTVAWLAGEALGWPVISSDRTRKELAGIAPHLRGDASARAQLYQKSMTRRTYEMILNRAIESARTTGGAILEATFSQRAQRDLLRATLATAGIRYRLVEITASDEEIIARLRGRAASRQEVSDAWLEDFEMLRARSDPLHPNEAHSQIASQSNAEATTTDLLKAMVASSPAWPEPQPRRGIKEKM